MPTNGAKTDRHLNTEGVIAGNPSNRLVYAPLKPVVPG